MSHVPTPVNRRAAVDLEAITTTALELFYEYGFDGTSMGSIATKLGVTKAALYYHAPGGKEQILDQAMHRVMDPLWLSLQEPGAVDGTSSQRLRYVLSRQVDLILEGMPEIGFFLLPVAHHPRKAEARARRRAYETAIRQLFDQSRSDGMLRTDLDPSVMLKLILGMGYSVNEWYSPRGRLSFTEIRDTALALIFTGASAQ